MRHASTTGGSGLGAGVALALLPLCEAGVPVGVPADLLMFLVGERASAGAIPVWLAVVGLEFAAVVGTSALFFAVRGPARANVLRLGRRAGLTEDRLDRTGQVITRRGPLGIAAARATPGLRTISVLVSALSALPARRVLLALVAGSTVFIQGHLVLGLALGSAAREALDRARGPALAIFLALAVVGLVIWISRRGRRRGTQGWMEASCPVCLAIAPLAGPSSS